MHKPFTLIAVALLSLIALMQLLRVLLGWAVMVEGLAIPVWASVAAFVVSAGLAAMVWRERR